MSAKISHVVLTAIASIFLMIGVLLPLPSVAAQPTNEGAVLNDQFDRDHLGQQYDVINPDPNRFALVGGKLVLVGAEPVKNFVLLKKNLPGDFEATVEIRMALAQGNRASLYYQIDEKNYLHTGIVAATHCQSVPWASASCGREDRRQPYFTKVVGGQGNNIVRKVSMVGSRSLAGHSDKEETWYLLMRRKGIKYTAEISADGTRWTDLGTHVVIPKHGRLGIAVSSGGGVENAAEVNQLAVKE